MVPWERHSSSRPWARQHSTSRIRRIRLPGRPLHPPLGRSPPPPPTRTADDSPVSHPGAVAGWSARARRSAGCRHIARPPGGPDRQKAPGLGGRERLTAWRPPRGAGLQRLSGRPLHGAARVLSATGTAGTPATCCPAVYARARAPPTPLRPRRPRSRAAVAPRRPLGSVRAGPERRCARRTDGAPSCRRSSSARAGRAHACPAEHALLQAWRSTRPRRARAQRRRRRSVTSSEPSWSSHGGPLAAYAPPRRARTNTSRPQGGSYEETGGDLLSQALASQVPSALWGLTALFGMGRGVSPTQ